jgi:hypothetical protein
MDRRSSNSHIDPFLQAFDSLSFDRLALEFNNVDFAILTFDRSTPLIDLEPSPLESLRNLARRHSDDHTFQLTVMITSSCQIYDCHSSRLKTQVFFKVTVRFGS